jgi:sodium-dependent dicarboxylate transporter 2/3/5
LNDIPGIQQLSFASWLVWGIPLVIIFVGIAGLIISAVLRPWRHQQCNIQLPFDAGKTFHPFQKITVWMTVFYFVSSFVLSLFMMSFPGQTILILYISGILTLLFVLILFFLPVKVDSQTDSRQVLLTLADCYNELPTRGFIFVGIAVVLAAILYAFGIHEFFAGWAASIVSTDLSVLALFFLIALATSFSTEVLSNTAVQLSFFVTALPLAQTLGFSALEILIIVTLSCTSAFMSPIATGVNGLAFGGVKDVSFSKMLVVGFIMNLAGAGLISSWVLFIVGRLYGLVQN